VLGILDKLGAELGTALGCSLGGSATTAFFNPLSANFVTISPDCVCFSTKPDEAAVFATVRGAVITDFTLKHFLPAMGEFVSKVQG